VTYNHRTKKQKKQTSW